MHVTCKPFFATDYKEGMHPKYGDIFKPNNERSAIITQKWLASIGIER